jgi:hypothetical protein
VRNESGNRFAKGCAVQRIGWIIVLLVLICWWATELPVENAAIDDQPKVQSCWRRTVNGWENISQWNFGVTSGRPALHPFYMSMILCTAAAGLAVCSCFTIELKK